MFNWVPLVGVFTVLLVIASFLRRSMWLLITISVISLAMFCYLLLAEHTASISWLAAIIYVALASNGLGSDDEEDEEEESDEEAEEPNPKRQIRPKFKPMRHLALAPAIAAAVPVHAGEIRCIHCGCPNKVGTSRCESCGTNPRI